MFNIHGASNCSGWSSNCRTF
uniref:ATP binding / GTP binding / transcription factor binding n=1 Tax=Arundo donax TaxID=35708 RepID=A0A0A9D2K5_ARUDO